MKYINYAEEMKKDVWPRYIEYGKKEKGGFWDPNRISKIVVTPPCEEEKQCNVVEKERTLER